MPIYAGQIATGAGGEYESPQECKQATSSEGMLDPTRIMAAYDIAKQAILKAQLQIGNVEVIVADNGFLGATLTPEGSLDYGIGFPRRFFYDYDSHNWDGVIGPNVRAGGDRLSPILDRTQLDSVNVVSGHGTHITGLVLGGGAFYGHTEIFDRKEDESWLRVSVMNMGNGQANLVDGSELSIAELIGTLYDKIINLSLVYSGDVDDSLNAVLQKMVAQGDQLKNLYVVAAGNNSRDDLQRVPYWPATLGGLASKNVVTVASHRQNGALTVFTNRGPLRVDIAAPGCEMLSWLDNSAKQTPVSGTSQAAAVTTFAAVLLKSLGSPSSHWIKRRLMISGELLQDTVPPTLSADQGGAISAGDILSRSRLSVPIALTSMDDFIRYQLVGDAEPTESLGTVVKIDDLICIAGGTRKSADLWAIKRGRSDGRTWLFTGRKANSVDPPCELATAGGANLWFKERIRLNKDGTRSTAPVDSTQKPIPVNALWMYVARTPPTSADP